MLIVLAYSSGKAERKTCETLVILSMANDIYDPLEEYVKTFRPKFEQVARNTFAQLAKEAQVDIKANQETCSRLYDTQEELEDVNHKYKWTRILCFLLWGCVVLGGFYLYKGQNVLDTTTFYLTVLLMVGAVLCLIIEIHPRMNRLSDERDDLELSANDLEREAWQQMAPLNRLYDWDMLARMITATVPKIEFDPYFTTQRLADLRRIYGWNDSFNTERSVIYAHSGLINGNPFVLCRTRKMEMGTKTYYGSKTIHWTTEETDSDGKRHTVHHSETLTASVTAPFPEYYERTRLFYGNTAAPDLTFTRESSGLASREGSLSYRWQKHKLKRKARDLDNSDYAMMTNEEFEVAFNTSDRNNNQQFALLFTPLAQENMLKLLRDKSAAYGDDFDFIKDRMINVIIPEHMQSMELDMDPRRFDDYDYVRAEKDFYRMNADYFRAIYFTLAPLLCVPMYQQIRPIGDMYGRDMKQESTFWDHEAIANHWGQERFKAPSCVTDCILKTAEAPTTNGTKLITVYAHGYYTEQRLSLISKYGGDGRWHNVPVYWDEYLPVTGQGTLHLTEDNATDDPTATPQQRLNRISKVLSDTHMKLYRKHIASRL